MNAGEAANRLDTFLQESVRMRMISDVPIGAFLSGWDRFVRRGVVDAIRQQPAGADVYRELSRIRLR
jgi:hypothetical protein